jgi:inosine-uridine nucleoside N-ribohydrolase
MIRRLSAENRGTIFESIHKESTSHVPLCYINPMQSRRRPALSSRPFVIFICLWAVFGLAHASPIHCQTPPRQAALTRTVIVDTDAGSDDLMAIAFLLSRPDIHVEAITIANGMAHVPAGGKNILRLLELAGRRDVPVFLGSETPLSGNAEFPAIWRQNSDNLPGVKLPEAKRGIETRSAADYLSKRLAEAGHPVQVLALGPLTDIAEAFKRNPWAARAVRQLVIMGGAVHVPGNLGDGGVFRTNNTVSEWNMFIDPSAAKTVFSSGAPIRLVSLDATQRVPIDMALFEEFQAHASTPLAHFVSEVLATNRDLIHQGFYFAWDPLAAVALANPAVVRFRPMALEVSPDPAESGRTLEVKKGRANVQVAVDADQLRFRETFMNALGVK